MPTNSIKHNMLIEAKRVANTSFEEKKVINRGLDGSILGYSIIPASMVRNDEINIIIKEHPEFDAGEFRRMIIEIQVRQKENKNELPS